MTQNKTFDENVGLIKIAVDYAITNNFSVFGTKRDIATVAQRDQEVYQALSSIVETARELEKFLEPFADSHRFAKAIGGFADKRCVEAARLLTKFHGGKNEKEE